MAKRLFDKFEEYFHDELKSSPTYTAAFNQASKKFEQQHGFQAYDSYDPFRKNRERRLKKR